MSAIRLPGPDGRIVLVPIDDGCTPHRSRIGLKGGFANPIIGGSLVTAQMALPRIVSRKPVAPYKPAVKDRCDKPMLTGKCARVRGHNDACKSDAAMRQQALAGRTWR